jgi:hypothetical protein
MRFTVTVIDNWYAIRIKSTGRLLSVGTWLPPDCDGIEATRVDHGTARDLLAELDMRAREGDTK